MTSPASAALANLASIGKLKVEAPDPRELGGLMRSASVRLRDARLEALRKSLMPMRKSLAWVPMEKHLPSSRPNFLMTMRAMTT